MGANKSDRFALRVHPRWIEEIEWAAEGRDVTPSEFVRMSALNVAQGAVVPSAWLDEAIRTIEEAQDSMGGKMPKVREMLDDAINCLTSAEDGDFPEDSAWAVKRTRKSGRLSGGASSGRSRGRASEQSSGN